MDSTNLIETVFDEQSGDFFVKSSLELRSVSQTDEW